MLQPNYVDYVIGRESGGDPTAKNPRSSAFGLGQFIDSTWADMAQRYPGQITMEGRNDPAQQRLATELYGKQNAELLMQNGIEPTNANVYATHFLGPGAALKALKADPSSPMSALLDPKALEANPQLAGQTVSQFRQGLEGPRNSAQPGSPQPLAPAPQPQGGMQQVVPPGASAGRGPSLFSNPQGWWNSPRSGDDISHAGIALMAMSNPEAAKVLLAQQQQGQGGNAFDSHMDSNGNIIRVNKRTGEVLTARSPTFQPKIPEGALKNSEESLKSAGGAAWINSQAEQVLRDIQSGDLKLGVLNNWKNYGKNLTGLSDAESQAYARFERVVKDMANTQLLAAKGVQTEGDAYRAMQQFIAGAGKYDEKTMIDSLGNVINKGRMDLGRVQAGLNAHKSTYGDTSFKHYDEQLGKYRTNADEALKVVGGARERFKPKPAGKVSPSGFQILKVE